jgi:hypothetical protein
MVCLSILWLRELTLRRAIEVANYQMMSCIIDGGYFLYKYQFKWFYFSPEAGESSFTPGWSIWYEPTKVFSQGPTVHVSLFGKIKGTSVPELTDALSLPYGKERKQAFEELLK